MDGDGRVEITVSVYSRRRAWIGLRVRNVILLYRALNFMFHIKNVDPLSQVPFSIYKQLLTSSSSLKPYV